MTNRILYPLCRYATTLPQRGGGLRCQYLTLPLTMGLPQDFVLRDDNNSLLASDARGLKAGVGEVVSKFNKHLGGCDGVVNGAVGVV